MSDPLRPVLIMVRGLPGSGKSYLARHLQKRLGSDVVMLDPDGTDYTSEDYVSFSAKLTSEGVDEKLHPYRYLRAQAYKGITDHKVIIWNQAFTNNDLLDRTIKNLQAYAAEHDEKLPAMVVEVSIDAATAKQRVAERHKGGGHNVDDAVFERFINDYTTFAGYEYPLVEVKGDANADESAEQILELLGRL